jgi:hypothetical protein
LIYNVKSLIRDFVYIDEGNGCWLWKGTKSKYGYGLINNQWSLRVHRIFYQHYIGEIPKGMCICHTCDVRHCVNPAHLFIDTRAGNIADRDKKGRTARGNKNSARLHPEKLARGDQNGARTHPETRRGERNGSSKLKENDIKEIFRLWSQGYTKKEIAQQFKVKFWAIKDVLRRATWKHIKI